MPKENLEAIIRNIIFSRLNTDNKKSVTVTREQLHNVSKKLYEEFLYHQKEKIK